MDAARESGELDLPEYSDSPRDSPLHKAFWRGFTPRSIQIQKGWKSLASLLHICTEGKEGSRLGPLCPHHLDDRPTAAAGGSSSDGWLTVHWFVNTVVQLGIFSCTPGLKLLRDYRISSTKTKLRALIHGVYWYQKNILEPWGLTSIFHYIN